MKERGFISKELEKQLVKRLDEEIKLKGFMEMIDGPIISLVLGYADNTLVDKYIDLEIQERFKEDVVTAITGYVSGNWEMVSVAAGNVIDELVDIPGVAKETEEILFTGIFRAIFEVIEQWALRDKVID